MMNNGITIVSSKTTIKHDLLTLQNPSWHNPPAGNVISPNLVSMSFVKTMNY